MPLVWLQDLNPLSLAAGCVYRESWPPCSSAVLHDHCVVVRPQNCLVASLVAAASPIVCLFHAFPQSLLVQEPAAGRPEVIRLPSKGKLTLCNTKAIDLANS